MRTHPTLFAIAFICLAQQSPSQTLQQARAFINAAYATDTNPASNSPIAETKIFTPSLIRLFALDRRRAHGGIGNLDYDPLCTCQDPGGLKYKIPSIKLTPLGQARAQISLSNSPEGATWKENITLDLLWTQRGWRIDDVHGSHASLRENLSRP